MNLKHCTPVLFVNDASKSRDFYAGVLGMTIIADFGGLNVIFKEGLAVWQIMDGNMITEKLGRSNIENPESVSRFEIVFETDDIDIVNEKLKKNNVKLLHEVNTEVWGQRTIRFYDPDGHLIEVGEAMPVFLKKIYEEEGRDVEATSKRTYMPEDVIRNILGLES
ncbi:MAG: VOC family protein [Dysgonomonas sp.]